MKAILEGDQISFNYFRKITYRKHVKFTWRNTFNSDVRIKECTNFFIYPEYLRLGEISEHFEGTLSGYTMKGLILGKDLEFFKINETKYQIISYNNGDPKYRNMIDLEILEDLSWLQLLTY